MSKWDYTLKFGPKFSAMYVIYWIRGHFLRAILFRGHSYYEILLNWHTKNERRHKLIFLLLQEMYFLFNVCPFGFEQWPWCDGACHKKPWPCNNKNGPILGFGSQESLCGRRRREVILLPWSGQNGYHFQSGFVCERDPISRLWMHPPSGTKTEIRLISPKSTNDSMEDCMEAISEMVLLFQFKSNFWCKSNSQLNLKPPEKEKKCRE